MHRKLLPLLLALLLTAAPSLADICFYSPGTQLIHADPLCTGAYTATHPLTPVDSAAPEVAACARCPICWRTMTQTPDLLSMLQDIPEAQRYYNPTGGQMYHYDSQCSAVRSKYLPLTALSAAESDRFGLTACLKCAGEPSGDVLPIYLRTLPEKAAALPEVWDLPAAGDIPQEQAEQLAMQALRNAYHISAAEFPQEYLTLSFYYPADAALKEPAYYKVCFATCDSYLQYDAWQVWYFADVAAHNGEILRMGAAQ